MEKRKQRHGFGSFGTIKISILDGTIISSFFPEAEEMTIKEIQERVDYSYERVNSSLKSLTKKKIIIEKQKGKTLVYSLDLQNLYAESMGFNAYMLEREIEFIKKHKVLYGAIKNASDEIFGTTILFGSYAKRNETKQSDVDLMIISDSEKQVQNKINEIKLKYGFNVSLAFVKITEFPKIKKENPELWKDLKNYAIVFTGGDLYYYWMYKNEKN